MKKYFFSLALIPCYLVSNAQSNWSVGFRTGAELTKTININEEKKGILFSEQLFVTKKIFKNFEIELNTSYKSSVNNTYFYNEIYDGPEYLAETNTSKFLEIGMNARYFIFNKKGWSSYCGLGLNTVITYNSTNGYAGESYGWGYYPATYFSNKSTNTNMLDVVSFSLGTNKRINEHWSLNAQAL